MVVIGFDEPVWAVVFRQAAGELAATITRALPSVQDLTLEPNTGQRRVDARCSTRQHDHYGPAYDLTELLASSWVGFVEHELGLRIVIDGLQVDVPARFFTDPGSGVRRRRWATLARTELVPRVEGSRLGPV